MTRVPRGTRVLLEKLFTYEFKGVRGISKTPVTLANVTLNQLHDLQRRGLVTYEDAPLYKQTFGVMAWRCCLTEKGVKELEAVK